MIRAVLDTNIFVSAVINIESSVASEIYQNFKEKHFLLVTSPRILAEIYSELQLLFAQLSQLKNHLKVSSFVNP